MLYRVIVNSSGDQKAIYGRALCYDPMITSYGNFSKKGIQREISTGHSEPHNLRCA